MSVVATWSGNVGYAMFVCVTGYLCVSDLLFCR